MHAIKGIYKNGQVVPSEPMDWPEGTEVRIEPISTSVENGRTGGENYAMPEEEQPDDPAAIARWLADFDAIPPLQMTPEEEANWQAARQAQNELEKATFFERAEKLRSMWQ